MLLKTLFSLILVAACVSPCVQSTGLASEPEANAGVDHPSAVTAWLLTWRGDPTTTQVIDWHQSGAGAADALPFRWQKQGDGEWSPAIPESFPFPFSPRWAHRLELTALEPDTLHEFQIADGGILRFRTLPTTLERPLTFRAFDREGKVFDDFHVSARQFPQ